MVFEVFEVNLDEVNGFVFVELLFLYIMFDGD